MTPVALVVGGSGGIGRDITRRLAADGFDVVVGYRTNGEDAARLVEELRSGRHTTLALDVTDETSLAAAVATLTADSGRLDVLVNGAGVTRPVAHDDLDGLDDQLISTIFDVNWRGPFATIRRFRPLLELGSNPVVVNISSIAGTTGKGSNVAYCASKAALDSMTRSLGRALAPEIRVVSVAPGWVLGEYAERMPVDALEGQRAETPLARLATGADVAAAVSAVVRDLPMTTGAVIPVDGGRALGVR